MAQAMQEKLEESLGEDAADDVEASAASSPPPKVHSCNNYSLSLAIDPVLI